MQRIFLRVKGIIKKEDRYLVLKRWMDDRIPDPFVWEFVDGEVAFSEAPDDAMHRCISEMLGVDGRIERIAYTWSQMLGDTQCIGIAYICCLDEVDENISLPEEFGGFEWITEQEIPYYIENSYVLKDLEKAKMIDR